MRTMLLLAGVLMISACAGTKARENALLPAARLAWNGVQNDVVRGIQDGVDDGELTQAQAAALNAERTAFSTNLRSEEPQGPLTPAWASLRPWAERGIQDRVDDGEASAGVAASLLERVNNFEAALISYDGGN